MVYFGSHLNLVANPNPSFPQALFEISTDPDPQPLFDSLPLSLSFSRRRPTPKFDGSALSLS
ncbi:hypothetical protein RchiOBHm_Chr2g0109271 [Rosa chinensis]|uniref:Uncharacterized protein n=1 Tax=Rosa chinensis TaxID=74649 RepID=A0A2P6RPJ3_ROSCH|nr:hypothetical protein RchiOBHm_Chr2g0109271 [Rosa chinensis]